MSPAQSVSGKPLVLLVDKENFLAQKLANSLAQYCTVVVVSKEKIYSEKDVIHVPYLPPLPQIPEGGYSRIIFLWNEKEKHLLEPLIQKARLLHAPLFVICTSDAYAAIPEEFSEYVFVLGDIFDSQSKFVLTEFLQKAKKNKHIKLSNMGLHKWQPVSLLDAIAKISEIVLHIPLHKRIFIGPGHSITALSIAHALQKIDPEITIDFSGENEEETEKPQHLYAAFDQYDSMQKLQKTYKDMQIISPIQVHEEGRVVFPSKSVRKQKFPFWISYVIYLLLLVVLLPASIALASGGAGIFLLSTSIQDIKKGDSVITLEMAQAATQNFSLAQVSLSFLQKEASLVGQGEFISYFQQKIVVAQKISQITASCSTLIESLSRVLSGKTLSPQTESENVVAAVKHMQALLQEIGPSDVPLSYQADLTNAKSLLSIAASIVDELPQILQIKGDVSYLILFQNNMELRPGGGFIGSYGILHLHNGSVKDFTIHDVYDADGQLKGHVEPPFVIRRYIPLVHLYLRDSNFDPDFTINAQKAAQLYFLETGEQVHGVWAVDLTTLRAVLSAVGSVYVPSYSETVTDKNFFTLLEKHAEKNFFPGSTQKKDFLNAFAVALMNQIQQKKTLNGSILLDKIVGLFQGKDILVTFADSILQQPFILSNLSGSLQDARLVSSTQVNDFLASIEANIGVNKVNAFVERSVSQEVTITPTGDVDEMVSLTLINKSDGSWPGGVYTDYQRFMLPIGAVLNKVLIDNVEQKMIPAVTDPKVYEAKSFVAPKGLEVNHEKEDGKEVYGFLIHVPIKTTSTIQIFYTIPHAFTLSNQKQNYSLMLWKQPGVEDYSYSLQIQLPSSAGFLDGTIPVSPGSSTAVFETQISKDTIINVSFAQK